jgi:hypothetical protein
MTHGAPTDFVTLRGDHDVRAVSLQVPSGKRPAAGEKEEAARDARRLIAKAQNFSISLRYEAGTHVPPS